MDIHTDRQMDRQIKRKIYGQKNVHIYTDRQMD